ncbi:MAG: hypothetical protein Q4D06_03850 [Coriobacteriia bacterium]|nr:hypothetical protein [Coriobacteriia bacterium]
MKFSTAMTGTRKMLALLVAGAAAFGAAGAVALSPVAQQMAFAEESVLAVPDADRLTLIGGNNDDGFVYYYEADQAYESIDLSALGDFGLDSMIAVINGDYFVEGSATASIDLFAATKEDIDAANLGLYDDAIEGLDLNENVYVFWFMDDDYYSGYLVLKMPPAEAAGCPGEDHDPGFLVSSESGVRQFESVHVANSYEYYDYMANKTLTVCQFTVKIPQGTKKVTIDAEKPSLFYNYQNGQYVAGWVEDYTQGAESVTVDVDANNDGTLDAIQVQDVYNADYSGGDLRYAIAFEEIPAIAPAVDVDALKANLAARFSKGGSNAVIDNSTWAAAIALNALGKEADIDAEAILADLADLGADTLTPGQLGKYIMVLTSAGVDCTKAKVGESEVDLVQMLKDGVKAKVDGGKAIDECSAPCIVPVFGCCGYDATGFETYLQGMISTMVKKVPSLYEGWGSIDVMSTGQAVLALIPYAEEDDEVATALGEAFDALMDQLQENGSFPTQWGNGVDDTALGYAAVKALGADDLDLFTASGAHPLSFLASKAKETADGFNVSGEALSASSALLALAAAEVDGPVYQVQKPEADDPDEGDEGDEGDGKDPDEPADIKPGPTPLKSATVSAATKPYNGKSQALKISVKGADGKALAAGVDYTLSRKTVKYVGTYKIKITGKGKYGGILTKYVKVNPAKEGMDYAKAGKKRALVKTTKSAAKCGATKIQFAYKKVGASKWSYKTVKASKTYLTKLSKGKRYYVKARAIKVVNGKTYKGAWSACKKTAKIR